MRLRYFGQTDDKARMAVLEWEDHERSRAMKIIAGLENRWNMRVYEVIAYISVESKADYGQIKKIYDEIKREGL